MKSNSKYTGLEIAIVGMACRFPGAANWREFWNNLVNGVESTRFFSEQELLDMGVDRETFGHPDYVPARNRMEDKDRFDAAFFDYLPSEAHLMNPTHRLFHECVWEALEDAGYSSPQEKDLTGVFAGAGDDLNWRVYAMLENKKHGMDDFSIDLITNQDHMATLVSYKLNLKGPAITLNTACSTSLTAIDMACKSLLMGESRMALAGGITVTTDKRTGYHYKEGMIYSSDGHCRPFDNEASGTTGSEGVGVVVLKKLNDALKDGDQVYAVIKGSSVNNDGNRKVGFTAPSVKGQADCIRKAHKMARIEPDTIGYVEAHGTATRLGDPIEVEALVTAFNRNSNQNCALGSVKSNIGHTGSAAGVAGLIKTALCLKHAMIPPSLNYSNPNPAIDFSSSPFHVNQSLKKWERRDDTPLRAGISSFGIGGTNAHAVLEEAPLQEETTDAAGYKLLTLSAKTEKSLRRYIDRLKNYLAGDEPVNLADMAYTFQVGRKHFEYRKSIAFADREELLSLLEAEVKEPVTRAQDGPRKIVFMFSGQGAQYAHMAADLYRDVPLFREEMDRGLALIQQLAGEDFREVLFPAAGQEQKINETRYTQPLLFVLEYALARVVMSLGLIPSYMIGHSIGEYTAAALSGVLSFEDAVRLVVKRGELMNSLPTGSMLSVLMSEEEAKALATGNIYLAAVNAPGRVVFSGEKEAIDALYERLKAQDISCIPLQTSHAFHSGMQDPILDEFRSEVARTAFGKISTPFLSNLTGDFITEEQASSPDYWTRHLRNTVQFSAGIQTLLAQEGTLQFIEIGPGQSLSGLLKQQPGQQAQAPVNLVRSEKKTANDLRHFTEALGQLWTLGTSIDWNIYHKDENRRRISLPTYSFEPTKYVTEVSLAERGVTLDAELTAITGAQEIIEPLQESGYEPELALSYDTEDDGEGLTVTERRVKALFRSFFGLETLSLSDNFFGLGGDSLKGLVLVKKIKEEFGVDLTLKQFFERPMLSQVAFDIDELKNSGEAGQPTEPILVEIPKAPEMDGYPLSSSQRRSWILSQFEEANAAYNMPGVYIFEGDLDTEAFEYAFDSIINRHEALRTVFREDGQGEIRQYINTPEQSGIKLVWEDARNQPDAERLEMEHVRADIVKPFDLAKGPIIRGRVCRIHDDKWVFTYVTHHIISDGWSLGVLFRELVQFYDEYINGRESSLEPLRIQFKDYSAWQQAELQGEGMKAHKEYWMKQFEGELPVIELKGDRPRPVVKTYNGGCVSRIIPAKLVSALTARNKEQGGTLFMSLLTVLKALLYRYTYQEDIIIGFPIAGRQHAELDNQIGFYVNTLPLRTRFSGNDSFKQLFERIKQVTVGAYEHQVFPFDEIVDSLSLRRDVSRNALFDVMVIIQKNEIENYKESAQKLGDLRASATPAGENPAATFDVLLNFTEVDDVVRLRTEYNTDIFDELTISRFTDHYIQMLEALLKNPDQQISKLQFLTPAEKNQLVAGFNGLEGLTVESEPAKKPLDFSLFYFGNEENEDERYKLLMEGARFADNNGFTAVWTPERHFNRFGGPYPNPSVLGAALAAITKNIQIRAGSVVIPLHPPQRIAEDWAIVDSLSGGRAGFACASGWHVQDFTIAPENYKKRHEVMYRNIELIRRLWRGERVSFEDGNGQMLDLEIFPKPVRQELPLWITSAGNIETFISAGKMGTGVLTLLVSSKPEEMAEKIAAYRKAYRESGHEPGKDKVVLMLHTYVGANQQEVYDKARTPFINYLKSSLDLVKVMAHSVDNAEITQGYDQQDIEEMYNFAYTRYVSGASLIGTKESCMDMLATAAQIGADEIACLIDFGVDTESVLQSLRNLTELKDAYNAATANRLKEEEELPVLGIAADDYRSKTIISLFEEQVAKNPQGIALVFQGKEISYAELNERSNRLAHYLRERYALQNEDRVGIRLERTDWMVTSLLGVLKTGAAYVPIATDYPQERIDFILKDSSCKAIIDQQELGKFRSEENSYESANPSAFSPQPSHLAYVIYTSGSTGKPKGVMVEHRNVTALLENMQSRFFLEPGMVFGAVTNYTFDISVLELLGTLATGIQLQIIGDTAPLNIVEYIRYGKINALQITPSRLAQLADADPDFMNTLKNLKTLLVGGEALSQYAYERLKTLEGTHVVNVYGPTETTVWSTSLELAPSTRLSIGKPLVHENVLVLDDKGGLSPIGVPGEICIGGAGLARGYLNRPDLTEEKFVPHPFITGERMYRTGDLGYWLADGNIEFIGREDEQVKIRGYRIELGEIEYALRQFPLVENAAVAAKQEPGGDKALVAYVVSKSEINTAELRAYLIKTLPAYMLPDHFVALESLPLNPNGKVDKKRLPGVDGPLMSSGVEYIAPRNALDEELARACQQVLGRERIGIADNFFEVGGNSLKLVKLARHVSNVLQKEVGVPVLFQYANIRDLSDYITQEAAQYEEELVDRNELISDLDKFNFD
ncbi:MAG TPA: MupA/Atu3671 family FMN-dependent luciferase-like monooxygenase [Flavisolibacter sp.]